MKKLILIILLALSIIIQACSYIPKFPILCNNDVKVCTDGSTVGRSNIDCEFLPCPELKTCNLNIDCERDYSCYITPLQEEPFCFLDYRNSELKFACKPICNSLNCNIQGFNPVTITCLTANN